MIVHRLYSGTVRRPLIELVPDDVHPGMWRMQSPDGGLSDMVNLARAKDAADAERGPPVRNRADLHWRTHTQERRTETHPCVKTDGGYIEQAPAERPSASLP